MQTPWAPSREAAHLLCHIAVGGQNLANVGGGAPPTVAVMPGVAIWKGKTGGFFFVVLSVAEIHAIVTICGMIQPSRGTQATL